MFGPSTPPRKRILQRIESVEKESRAKNINFFEEAPQKRHRTKSPGPKQAVIDNGFTDQILEPLKPTSIPTSNVDQIHGAVSPEVVFPLVGRESECAVLQSFLQRSLGVGTTGERCLYVSGGPGTGKTCSVRAAVHQLPKAHVFEVNCMDLSQRSVAGFSDRLAQKCVDSLGGTNADHARCRLARQASPVGAAVAALRMINGPTVIIIDEVDQLVRRGGRSSGSSGDLEDLLSLAQQPEGLPVAIILIANAVDLLTRANLCLGCASLLFTPYDKDQLRQIAMARLDMSGITAALDKATVEVRVRQVAKQSGDCRQVLAMCEDAKFMSADATGPIKLSTKSNDPLQSVSQLPMDQQLLLCVLAGSESEAVKTADVCIRYKQMCRTLRQPINLGTNGNVNSALCQLEQRGLLSLRKAKANTQVAELAMTRDRVRDSLPVFMQRFFN